MKSPEPSLHRHRFARAETWVKLWLHWLGRYLAARFGFLPPLPRAVERECQLWLDQVAKLVAWLLIVRACAKLEGRSIVGFHHRRGVPSTVIGQAAPHLSTSLRVILGSELRRAFDRGSIGERIDFLYRVLANMDGFAAKLAKRMAKGVTRLTPILGPPASSPESLVLAPCASLCAFAIDTS